MRLLLFSNHQLDVERVAKILVNAGVQPHVQVVGSPAALEQALRAENWSAVVGAFSDAQQIVEGVREAAPVALVGAPAGRVTFERGSRDVELVPTEAELPAALRRAILNHRERSMATGETILHAGPSGAAQLRQVEDRFRLVIEGFSDPILFADQFLMIRYANRSFLKTFGYHLTDVIGQPFQILLDLEEKQAVEGNLAAALKIGEAPQDTRHRLRRKDDRWEIVSTTANSLDDPSQYAMLILHLRVITAQVEQARKLEHSEARLRAIVENSPYGIATLSPRGKRLEWANPAMSVYFGYSPSEFKRLSIQDLHPASPTSELALLMSHQTYRGFQTLRGVACRRKDQSVFYCNLIFGRIQSGDETCVMVFYSDVTQEYLYYYELEKAQSDLLKAQEIAQLGSWSYDISARTFSGTPQTYRFFGEENKAVEFEALVETIHPEDREAFQRDWERALLGETLEIEQRLLIGDQTRWLFTRAQPRPVRDGSRRNWIDGIFFDITERKLFEEELLARNERLERAEEHIQRQLRRLSSLRKIDSAIANNFDIHQSLKVVIDEAVAQLGVDAAAILLYEPADHTLHFAAGMGLRSEDTRRALLKLGEPLAGEIALQRETRMIPDYTAIKNEIGALAFMEEEGFQAYFGAPLIAKGQIKGVIEAFQRVPRSPSEDWLAFFETLAGQASVAIDSAQSFKNLQLSNLNLALAYDATIEGWSRAMDLRDKETEGHTLRVTDMTMKLARLAGMSEPELVHVWRGAMLHDMGKLGVPDHILMKPGKLTEEEWEIMRKHPVFAYEMLSPVQYLRPALDIPYCHHERWDGSGYPRGLRGEQIPLSARIFMLIDVLDALTSDRPYRAKWSLEKTLAYIQAGGGAQFDPRLVDLLMRAVREGLITVGD